MDYRDVAREEKAQAAELGQVALDGAAGCFLPVLAAAAKLAVGAAIQKDPAHALRKLRTDSALLTAIEKTAQRAQRQAFGAIVAAIVQGYRNDAAWRGEALVAAGTGLSIDTSVTPDDERRLRDYPILGHSAAELAGYMVTQLRYGIDGALGTPLVGKVDPSTVPAALGDAINLHAARVASAVREAYFAGTQAAMRDLGAALTGQPAVAGSAGSAGAK